MQWPEGFPVGDYVRQARRRAVKSQREFAEAVGVSRSTLAAVEAGRQVPGVGLLERLLAAGGMTLVAVAVEDEGGTGERLLFVSPLEEFDGDCRDGADRRYPAHLALVVDPMPGEWWGDTYALARPPETFYRDRTLREIRRSLSQWEVRYQGVYPRWPLPLVRASQRIQHEQRDLARRLWKRDDDALRRRRLVRDTLRQRLGGRR